MRRLVAGLFLAGLVALWGAALLEAIGRRDPPAVFTTVFSFVFTLLAFRLLARL